MLCNLQFRTLLPPTPSQTKKNQKYRAPITSLSSVPLLHLLRRKRTEFILDSYHLIRTFLSSLDSLATLVRNIMLRLEDDALLTFLGIAASSIRKFERRRAPKVKGDVDFVALVYVHAGLLALANLHAGHGMDGLDEVDGGAAFAGLVRDAGDDEVAGFFGHAAEVGRLGLGVPFAVELVCDVEWWSAGEGVLDAFADAEVLAGLEGVD